MKLYTKAGDDGSTGLIGGARVLKSDPRVAAYGDIDELNAVLGWVAAAQPPGLGPRLQALQAELFVVGAELASPAAPPAALFTPLGDDAVRALEQDIDAATAEVPALRHFILPGGSEAAARLHVARAVCRRAERRVVALAQSAAVRPVIIHYLNRLGDLLFAWGRLANHRQGVPEIPWRGAADQRSA